MRDDSLVDTRSALAADSRLLQIARESALVEAEGYMRWTRVEETCVGHDSLFIKHSEAPVICLVAKDRVLAHNPVGALNCSNGYYRRALYESHRG
jgi:uncharacterized metal-binding protein